MFASMYALGRMDQLAQGMRGGICVADRGQNIYSYTAQANQRYSGEGSHIEYCLFSKMLETFKYNPANIPNNSTIVFMCEWSPCKLCCRAKEKNRNGIQAMVRAVNLSEDRNVRIKMRFFRYYCETEGAQGDQRWKDIGEATTAYEEMMSASRQINVLGRNGNKDRRELDIAQITNARAGDLRTALAEEQAITQYMDQVGH